MSKPSDLAVDLTKNQSLVMNALSRSNEPLSAYTILDNVRDQGVKAPLQIYRALDKLVELGLVHRLESLNAFVACQHASCEGQKKETVLFTICEKCGSVRELMNANLVKLLGSIADEVDFSLNESIIELRGLCFDCKVN